MRTMLNSRRRHYLARISTSLVVIALIAGMVGCVPVGCVPTEQEEEEEEEQYVEDWNELNAIRNKLSGTYFLANNLDKDTDGYNELASPTANGGRGWEPIGTSASADRFTGTFNGRGYSITGLYVSRPDEDDVGLFGYVEGGIIENVGLVEVDVTGGNHTGALVGYNERGAVGSDPVLPYSTYSTGSVTGSDTVGGLVGCNWDGTVSLSQSSAHIAHVSGECWRAGGLVGANWGNVLMCSYSGEVTGDHEVGGMVGLNGGLVPLAPTGYVISCQGEYTVTGNWFVGGAAGVNMGSLDSAIFKGEVNGALWKATSHIALNEGTAGSSHSSATAPQGSYVGGLVGRNEGSISNSFAVGSASGNEYIGGVAGYIDYGGTVNGCFAVATVEGTEHVGPLAGENNGIVTDSASGTAEQMMDIATFLGADWDICQVAPGEVNTACTWNMAPGDYPFLSGKQLEQYNLTISSTEGGEVTSPGEGTFTYYEGSVVHLVVEAEEGYQFSSWTGDVDTIADVNAASTTITVDDDYSITANFAKPYSLTISSTEGGSVTTPGGGTFVYDEGDVVKLVATPNPGYGFVNWTGDVGTIANANAASTTITMNGDYSITANFEVIPLTLLSPPVGSTGVPITNISFTWTPAGADVYDWVLDDNSDFSSPVDSKTGLTTTACTHRGPLAYNTPYYWMVHAYKDGAPIDMAVGTFTTVTMP